MTVPKGRKVTLQQRRGVHLHRADLGPDDVIDGVTTRDRTLVDCLRACDFGSALAVADSALRSGFPHRRLVAIARDIQGPGGRLARRVAAEASADAANAFESALRAIAADVPVLNVLPQVPIYAGAILLAAVAERTDRGCSLCRSA